MPAQCRWLNYKFTFGALVENLLNISQFARDPHSGQALQKISSVGFCTNARIENGDHAAVSAAADQTADPLFKRDHCLWYRIIAERTASIFIDKSRPCGDYRVGRDGERQLVDDHTRELVALHVDALPETGRCE